MYNYLTQESIDKLKKELDYRLSVLRFRINEDLKEARAHGDLSENFEYKAAKRDRAQNNGRMRYLQKMINTAIIITDTTEDDEVGLLKDVTVQFDDDLDTEIFTIVTTVDADPINNKVSIESPVGKAIYKKKVGDTVLVDSPQGKYNLTIKKIEKLNFEPNLEDSDSLDDTLK